MFWQVMAFEHEKTLKRRLLWSSLAILALLVVALYGLLFATTQLNSGQQISSEAVAGAEQALTWPDGLVGSIAFAAGPSLGGLLMVVVVGAIVAQEYSWGTVRLWLSQGISRPLFLGAKFAALLLPALLIVITPLVVGGLLTALFSQLVIGTIPFSQVDWPRLVFHVLGSAYTLLPYAGLTFFLAVVSRSTVVAVGGGLAYALLVEGIAVQLLALAGGIWVEIGRYLPAGLARGLLGTNAGLVVVGNSPVPTPQLLDTGPAALGIALYTLVFVGLAMLVFRRQDLSS